MRKQYDNATINDGQQSTTRLASRPGLIYLEKEISHLGHSQYGSEKFTSSARALSLFLNQRSRCDDVDYFPRVVNNTRSTHLEK